MTAGGAGIQRCFVGRLSFGRLLFWDGVFWSFGRRTIAQMILPTTSTKKTGKHHHELLFIPNCTAMKRAANATRQPIPPGVIFFCSPTVCPSKTPFSSFFSSFFSTSTVIVSPSVTPTTFPVKEGFAGSCCWVLGKRTRRTNGECESEPDVSLEHDGNSVEESFERNGRRRECKRNAKSRADQSFTSFTSSRPKKKSTTCRGRNPAKATANNVPRAAPMMNPPTTEKRLSSAANPPSKAKEGCTKPGRVEDAVPCRRGCRAVSRLPGRPCRGCRAVFWGVEVVQWRTFRSM